MCSAREGVQGRETGGETPPWRASLEFEFALNLAASKSSPLSQGLHPEWPHTRKSIEEGAVNHQILLFSVNPSGQALRHIAGFVLA